MMLSLTYVIELMQLLEILMNNLKKLTHSQIVEVAFGKEQQQINFIMKLVKKYKEIPEVTEKTLPVYLETIKEIVEQNRATDTEINAEQIAKLGFSAPTISIPKTGGSNVKIVSGIGKINIKTPNYIGKLKTTDTLVTGIIDLNPSYPIPDKTKKLTQLLQIRMKS